MIATLRYENDTLFVLDQTRLPHEQIELPLVSLGAVCEAIVRLAVRGAPAIGIAAAYGVVVGLDEALARGRAFDLDLYTQVETRLAATRPTAVNLFWALKRLRGLVEANAGLPWPALRAALLAEAGRIHEEDVAQNKAMGRAGAELLQDGWGILTHCNAGALATGGYGTALGVIRAAHEAGKRLQVYADETRPLLQGARLTAFELAADGIPVTLICDNMAATLMRLGKVQAVIVGSDRCVANGDVANKIGTYGVALAARAHGIPFYVALPSSTFDLSLENGDAIPIEERSAREVRGYGTTQWAANVPVWNPAFDVTPHELVTALITERGIIRPPYDLNIPQVLGV